MIKDFFRDISILGIIISFTVLVIVFIIIDGINTNTKPFYGTVLDKHYKAERNSTGTGYGMTSNGKMGMVVTSESESEKFLVMVKILKGKVVTVECSAELYYKKEIGDRIYCNEYLGSFTGWCWSLKGVR